jgi:NhaA family Na+:H+ antiporter
MATDTAFAISILTILGAKAPRAIFVMLTGLAIVDDMGAVAVISVFYTEQIVAGSLAWAGLTLLAMLLMNLLGIRKPIFYLAGGVLLWWFILQSGIHATTAGILAAMMIPTHPHTNKIWFRKKMENVVKNFKQMDNPHKPIIESEKQHALAVKAEGIAKLSTAPILRWGYALDKPVSLIILPLFAFLNAGVMLPTTIPKIDDSLITLAIMAALVLGKGIGISFFAWIGLKIGLVRLPSSVCFC